MVRGACAWPARRAQKIDHVIFDKMGKCFAHTLRGGHDRGVRRNARQRDGLSQRGLVSALESTLLVLALLCGPAHLFQHLVNREETRRHGSTKGRGTSLCSTGQEAWNKHLHRID